jgi:hypothetical protein
MVKQLFFTVLAAHLLSGVVWAQTASPEPAVKKCNRIMRNIYVDILTIKDTYEELKSFNDSNYDISPHSTSSIKVDSRVLDTDGIRYNALGSVAGSPGLDIHFSWQSCDQGCQKTPTLEITLSQLHNYLVVYLEDLSPRLTNELLQIIKKNAAAFK